DLVAIQSHNIERVQASLRQSRELAVSGIRPGVDTALFLSELSKAKIDGLNARKQLETAQWLLARLMVNDAIPGAADAAFLDRLPVNTVLVNAGADSSLAGHPLIALAQNEFAVSQSKEQLLKKSFLPKLSGWGTCFARGSGCEADGSRKTWDGMGLSRYNYGAGLQLSFPIMKYGEVRRQLKEQNLLSQAAQQRLEDTRDGLTTQQRITSATF